MLVQETSGDKIVCQSLVTGKISSIRREQFNRGSTGFFYATSIHDISEKCKNYVINGPNQPAAQPKDKVKTPDIDTRDTSDDTDLSISFMDDSSRIPEDDDICPVQPYLTTADDDKGGDASKLSSSDKQYFAELDKDLTEGWDIFEHIGLMLAIIKGERLYRETHPSFAAYCKDKLGMNHINNRTNIE